MSGVRMLIECKKPLFSTPDVFEIYPTPQYQDTTYPDTTAEITTTEITTIDSSTDETTDFQTLGCQFHENDHGAIFDTGSPYSNHMRKGLMTS